MKVTNKNISEKNEILFDIEMEYSDKIVSSSAPHASCGTHGASNHASSARNMLVTTRSLTTKHMNYKKIDEFINYKKQFFGDKLIVEDVTYN